MRASLANFKSKKQIESILLVCVLVAATMVIMFPLTAPKAKAQVFHLNSAADEDNDPMYDVNPAPGIVEWDDQEDHHITPNPMPGMPAYIVDPGYTLIFPALDAMQMRFINFDMGADRIEVGGTLQTTNDGNAFSKTIIQADPLAPGWVWDGIYFMAMSQGFIDDVLIRDTSNGVVFGTDSNLLDAGGGNGVRLSVFQTLSGYGLQLNGAKGYTNVANCQFNDDLKQSSSLDVQNGYLNITTTTFSHHGPNENSIHINNATVRADNLVFTSTDQPGNAVHIEGESNNTVFDNCDFDGNSVPGYHYALVEGSTVLFDNCSFSTSLGELSVKVNDSATGIPAIVAVLNPTADGTPGFWDSSFDNTTLDVDGTSVVALQWYVNVYVDDPNGNAIPNSEVNVTAAYGSVLKNTEATGPDMGWANWTVVTEFVKYSIITFNFNPFNVSAENFSMYGFASPEPQMDQSKILFITVPFNPLPNTLPTVQWISQIIGVQSGPVSFQYILNDPDAADAGKLGVTVYYSTDNLSFRPATQGGGDPTTGLTSGITYNFTWDSRTDEPSLYDDTVWIFIIPNDPGGDGPLAKSVSFILDNEPPQLISGPTVDVTDTQAIINWTVHENADALVWYGLNLTGTMADLIYEQSGSMGTTLQTVTLTSLSPGRKYSYVINSTDPLGNLFTYFMLEFETKVHIQLYKGWNMISLPPLIDNPLIDVVLAPIAGQYTAVQWYDPTDPNDPWKHYVPGKPFGNDLFVITPQMGVWIHMKNDALFVPVQNIPPSGYSESIPLVNGWNFVGYPSVTTRTVGNALTGVTYDTVQTYDAVSGKWYFNDGTPSSTFTNMELGKGYWIHVSSNQNWQLFYI